MDSSIQIFEIMKEEPFLFSLFDLKQKGYSKEFLDSHPNINSFRHVEEPVGGEDSNTLYFLMSPRIEDHVRSKGLTPLKCPERYLMTHPEARLPSALRIDPIKLKINKAEEIKRIIKNPKNARKYGDTLWCHYCARKMNDGATKDSMFTIDHWLPKNKGGRNVKENYRMCCYGCNQARNKIDQQEDIEMKFYYYVKYLNHLQEQGVERIHLDFLVHIL